LEFLGKGKELTFFVFGCNYLMTIINLVDPKGFRLEMLYGRRIFKNHDYRNEPTLDLTALVRSNPDVHIS